MSRTHLPKLKFSNKIAKIVMDIISKEVIYEKYILKLSSHNRHVLFWIIIKVIDGKYPNREYDFNISDFIYAVIDACISAL